MVAIDETGLPIPAKGQWPVDPQEDVPVDPERIWIDGCFDFTHHGHAGAMLQARQLGRELFVGVHSDEAILENKGPTVMTLRERCAAVDACRWSTRSIPHAPYVTSLAWISHYGCKDVVHGDDITSDASGEDCYRFVKAAGRFRVVKRTPGISTTDLVGRMLLYTKSHFIRSLDDVLDGKEGEGEVGEEERRARGAEMRSRISQYAADESGLVPGVQVWSWQESRGEQYLPMVRGPGPKEGQRIVYVDGGFDLFSPGHIAFLQAVVEAENKRAKEAGWDKEYPSAYVAAGIHDDVIINKAKGLNYPIMNVFERGLCVLQCRHINAVVFGAPYSPAGDFLRSSPWKKEHEAGFDAVYHGPAGKDEPYAEAKSLGIFNRVDEHEFQDLNAGTIVQRIMKSRTQYEERQRKKGEKATVEELERARQEVVS